MKISKVWSESLVLSDHFRNRSRARRLLNPAIVDRWTGECPQNCMKRSDMI